VLRRFPRPTFFAIAAASTLAAAGIWLGSGSASAGTLSGSLYRDPNSSVAQWVAANSGDSRANVIRTNVASQPAARWFANFNPSGVQAEASAFVNAANSAGQVPVISVYEITNRDCGGASAGGAPDLNQYQTWISNFSRGLGNKEMASELFVSEATVKSHLSHIYTKLGVDTRAGAVAAAIERRIIRT